MLQIAKASLRFGDRAILDEVTWSIHPGRRYGLVGPNGVGKSTLLRILAGEIAADSGQRILSSDLHVGYLPQELLGLSGRSVLAEAMTVFADVFALGEEVHHLERALAEPGLPPAEHEALLARYSQARDRFEHASGYALEHRARAVLFGLGFSERDLARDAGEFSGGWQSRLGLARLLLSQPDVLLLDEPTNHLDLSAIEWLENYLLDYSGAIVLVSHDRWFLDRLAHEIVYLWNGAIRSYKGDFTHFQAAREKEEEMLEKQHAERAKLVEKTQKFIERFRYKATKARQVQSRIRHLQKLEKIEVSPPPPVVHFRFPEPPPCAKVAVSLAQVSHDYGLGPVFAPFSADLVSGSKVGLVGPNGSGKTTLLKIMAGQLRPTHGIVRDGSRVVKATFDQDQAARLSGDHTILAELESIARGDMLPRLRDLLGVFLFSGDEVEKPLSVLSGGEKSRVSLAKILCAGANCLFLDEPTNHLDLSTRQSLEEAMHHFPGTLVVVSHDRYFMDRVVEEIWEVRDGLVRRIRGNYSHYLHMRQVEAQAPQAAPQAPVDKKESRRDRRRAEAAVRQKYSAERARIQKEAEAIEEEIAALEAERAELDAQLGDPAVYNDGDRSRQLVGRRREIEARLPAAYQTWEVAHGRLAQLEAAMTDELNNLVASIEK
ncbi:ABC-F family ATP-binding cassette domain-containing protein [bacterium]|nr:ABC-F family ATP-binding cassette domain-containing protein [bacterium]